MPGVLVGASDDEEPGRQGPLGQRIPEGLSVLDPKFPPGVRGVFVKDVCASGRRVPVGTRRIGGSRRQAALGTGTR